MPQVKKVKTTPKKSTVIASGHQNDDAAVQKSRKIKAKKYASFRLQKRIPHPKGSLPSSYTIIKKALKLMWQSKKTLAIVILVYAVLNFVFVRGFTAPISITGIRDILNQGLGEELSGSSATGAIFAALLGGVDGASSDAASVYQTVLFIVVSLAIIWVYRQYSVGKKTTAKEAYYGGMYPLVPFLLVIGVFFLQMIPFFLGGLIYQIASANDLAVTVAEQAIFIVLYAFMALLSLYMLSSSIFAIYIVTLPDMKPFQALRSARELVFSRRFSVFRKVLLIPVLAFLVLVVLLVPAIYFAPFMASWLFLFLSIGSIAFLHAYLFTLYKELL